MSNCKICCENIKYVIKYRLSEIDDYKNFDYCLDCLKSLLDNQWAKYISNLKKANCEQSLMSLIKDGPPINFRDTCIDDNKEIYEFYYNEEIHSAKLKGSLDEHQRYDLNNKLTQIIINSKNSQNVNDFDY